MAKQADNVTIDPVDVFGEALCKRIENHAKKTGGVERTRRQVADMCHTAGILAAYCYAPKSDQWEEKVSFLVLDDKGDPVDDGKGNPTITECSRRQAYLALLDLQAEALTAHERELLKRPTKGMKDVEKSKKREARQKMGAYLARLRSALQTREDAAEGKGASARTKPDRERQLEDAIKMYRRACKADQPDYEINVVLEGLKLIVKGLGVSWEKFQENAPQ